jgi:hypothetical protein
MLKTISAALLAVSVLAAPVLAATPASTAKNPAAAPVIKSEQVKPSVLNANAKMGRHHVKHRHHRHHRFHKKMGAIKTHAKVAIKHINHTAKRG